MPRPLLIIALLLAACAPPPEKPVERPNILLISVDTLRSDHLPAYGYTKVETPAIDGLRRDGVLYQYAYSHAPLTLPSHVSMLTGLLPTEHGVRNNIGYRYDASKFSNAARFLRERGYRTGAAVSSYVLRSETGLADGFDVYDDDVTVVSGGATAEHQRSGLETLERAKQWLDSPSDQPFFFFFHIYEPHAPYTPPEPFKSRYADPYDGEIAAADAIVGNLIQTLRQSNVYDNTAIIFTSDHGEALWQHGEDQHGILLYREVLQVPLIIKLPRSADRGTTVAEPFGLQQVFDTIIGFNSARKDPKPATPIYSETLYPRIHLGWSELRSMIEGRYHYIESSSPELYDLVRDPGESTNIIRSERRIAASLRDKLNAMPAAVTSIEPIAPEEAAKLAALGYVGTPRNRTGPLPNPRDEIRFLRDIKHAFQLASEKRNEQAAESMRALLRANPNLTDVSSRLGEVLTESARYDEAIEVYRAAMSRTERFSSDLALALAITYLKAGKLEDAATHAQLALAASPFEAREVLARVRMAEGRFAEASAQAGMAIEAGNRQPRSLLLLAELQRAQGNLPQALNTIDEAEQRAKQMGPGPVLGLDHLRADVLARLDRPDEAIAAYQREIENFPHHLQSYANLALIYLIQERPSDAERLFEQMARVNPHRGAYLMAARTYEAVEDEKSAAKWKRRAG